MPLESPSVCLSRSTEAVCLPVLLPLPQQDFLLLLLVSVFLGDGAGGEGCGGAVRGGT